MALESRVLTGSPQSNQPCQFSRLLTDQVGFPGHPREGSLAAGGVEVVLSEALLGLLVQEDGLLDVQLVLVPPDVEVRRQVVVRLVVIVEEGVAAGHRVPGEQVHLE